ncbi:hypothetical protein NDU88_003197, partial [Pleurodeles waltl]
CVSMLQPSLVYLQTFPILSLVPSDSVLIAVVVTYFRPVYHFLTILPQISWYNNAKQCIQILPKQPSYGYYSV